MRWQVASSHLHDGAHTAMPLQRAEVALCAVTGGWQREVDVLRAVRLVRRVQTLLGGTRSCLRLDEHLVVQRPLVRLCGNAACQDGLLYRAPEAFVGEASSRVSGSGCTWPVRPTVASPSEMSSSATFLSLPNKTVANMRSIGGAPSGAKLRLYSGITFTCNGEHGGCGEPI